MEIIKIDKNHLKEVVAISQMLWKNHSEVELEKVYDDLIKRSDAAVFLLKEGHEIVGFSQCQLRYEYVEGSHTRPVGYLEGIFVKKKARNKGYAKILIQSCEYWAKEKGCLEFASDSQLDNKESYHFHLANGFTECNRIICYIKSI